MQQDPSTLLTKFYAAAYRIAAPFLSRSSLAQTPVQLTSGSSRCVLRFDDVVVKIYDEKTEQSDVEATLSLLACPELRDIFVQPLCNTVFHTDGCLLTVWPAEHSALAEAVEHFHWEASAQLLGTLHNQNVGRRRLIRPSRWLARLGRLKSKMEASPLSNERKTILEAFATLPRLNANTWHTQPTCVVHGDWHPGQVVQTCEGLKLIDSDDVGLGDPMWDLARVAGWSLAGVVSQDVWNTFFEHYAQSRNFTQQQVQKIWLRLELPARAAAIMSASTALLHAIQEQRALEDYEEELVGSCQRIAKHFH